MNHTASGSAKTRKDSSCSGVSEKKKKKKKKKNTEGKKRYTLISLGAAYLAGKPLHINVGQAARKELAT